MLNGEVKELVLEYSLRIVLWMTFCFLNSLEPFHRTIRKDELWLYSYPQTPSIIPENVLWTIIFLYPLTHFTIEYVTHQKRLAHLHQSVLALTLSYCLNGVITTFLKVCVGRPRPDFLARCFPDAGNTAVLATKLATSAPLAPLDLIGECSGSRKATWGGRKSFPSGHASFIFACMTYMVAYVVRDIDFERRAKAAWKVCGLVGLVLVAAAVAISRTCDYHHHYEDVIFGSILGASLSCLTFWMYLMKD